MKRSSIIILIFSTLALVILGLAIYYASSNDKIIPSNEVEFILNGEKVTTRYFGNEVKHDFDMDGTEDVAFIVTQETGGSGTFYYLVALLNKSTGPISSEGFLLGDRIAPQTTEIGEGNIIIVNYADRKPGEPFSVPPSVGKSLWLLLDTKTMQFGEVVQNFEGESNVTARAKINETITVNEFFLTPLEVTQDSRCPVDVQCIWAGTVNLKTKVESRNKVQIITLILGTPIDFDGKKVILEKVTPVANSGKIISSEEYKFTISVIQQ